MDPRFDFIVGNYVLNVDGSLNGIAKNHTERKVPVYFKGMTSGGEIEDTRELPMQPGMWIVKPIWYEDKLEYWTMRIQ